MSSASAASRIGAYLGVSRYSPCVWELISRPTSPSFFARSISEAGDSGAWGATAPRPAKREGYARTASASVLADGASSGEFRLVDATLTAIAIGGLGMQVGTGSRPALVTPASRSPMRTCT
jgi:hypothetical protein